MSQEEIDQAWIREVNRALEARAECVHETHTQPTLVARFCLRCFKHAISWTNPYFCMDCTLSIGAQLKENK